MQIAALGKRPQHNLTLGVTPATMSVLEHSFREFEAARAQFQPMGAHLVPDIALLGFLVEISENAEAVQLLAESNLPHRAFPNARAAVEAAQNALVLATEADYDLGGARAWVFFKGKDRNYRQMPRAHVFERPEDADAWFEKALEEMSAIWEDLAPGKGRLISEARKLLDRQPKRPGNWAGLPMASTLQKRLNDVRHLLGKSPNEDISSVLNATYSALSRESHPRTGFDPIRIDVHADGQIEFVIKPRDRQRDIENVMTAASSALLEGILAIAVRITKQ